MYPGPAAQSSCQAASTAEPFNSRKQSRPVWRYVYWDYEDDGTAWDIGASGPHLGLGVAF